MRLFFLLSFTFLFFPQANAQKRIDTLIVKYRPPADTIKYWKTGGKLTFTLQNVYQKDWTRGDQPSFSLGTTVNLYAYYDRGEFKLENKLDAGISLLRQGESTNLLIKNEDFLIYIFKGGRKLVNKWYLDGILDFRTQFLKGFADNKVGDQRIVNSKFLNPGIISPSFGLGYKKDKFALTLAPLSGRFTFVTDDSLSNFPTNGVPAGMNWKSDLGANIVVSDNFSPVKNMKLRYNLSLFYEYETPDHIDVFGELFMNYKLLKYISVNFQFRVIYDDNVRIKNEEDNSSYVPWQINNVIDIGFIYEFGEKIGD
ncbi:MAG TPA: hypothetical protein DDY13_20165 [Cytophagales bacterium]|jgi:hypothetical protein|nr:hypothetical protein [Cytophagales bacterium]